MVWRALFRSIGLAGFVVLALAFATCSSGFAIDPRAYPRDVSSPQVQFSNTLAYAGLVLLAVAPVLSGIATLSKSGRRLGSLGLLAFVLVFLLLGFLWARLCPDALT